jgi:hypothetical protein
MRPKQLFLTNRLCVSQIRILKDDKIRLAYFANFLYIKIWHIMPSKQNLWLPEHSLCPDLFHRGKFQEFFFPRMAGGYWWLTQRTGSSIWSSWWSRPRYYPRTEGTGSDRDGSWLAGHQGPCPTANEMMKIEYVSYYRHLQLREFTGELDQHGIKALN